MYNPHALVVRSLIVSTYKAFPRKSSDEELKANSRVPLKSTYNAPPSKCSPVLVTLAYPMLGAETEPSVRRICAVVGLTLNTCAAREYACKGDIVEAASVASLRRT